MADTVTHRMFVPSCAVGILACTAAVFAQPDAFVEGSLDGCDVVGYRVDLRELGTDVGFDPDAEPVPRLWGFLPDARAGYLAAERTLARIEAEVGDGASIVAFLPGADGAAERVRGLRGRGPRGRFERLIDVSDRLRDALLGDTHVGSGAGYVLLDPNGVVLRAGRLGHGVRHEVADAAAGILDRRMALALVGDGDPEPWTTARNAVAPAGADGRLGVSHSALWCRTLRRLPPDVDVDVLRRQVDAALRALRDRPEFQAAVLETVARRWPHEMMRRSLRSELAKVVRAERRDEGVQRAGFVCFAAIGEERRARSCGFAWLETQKGIPGRLREVLRAVDATQDGAKRFPSLVMLVLDLAWQTDPADERLVRRAFEHYAMVLGDVAGATTAGRRLIDVLGSDSQALNSFAWSLMTRDPYAGRYRVLALEAARAMERDPYWRTYWRVDTLALACFRNGHIDEAIALQREALEGADAAARARYRERLERYQAARD
jgi:hypothetical protein